MSRYFNSRSSSVSLQLQLISLLITLAAGFSTQGLQQLNLAQSIQQQQNSPRVSAPVDAPFYPCSGFNSFNISSLVFSNKPNVFFDASFKITAKVNWDTVKLTNVRIVEYWDLFQTLDFSDDFRKTFKKGEDLVYESPIMSPQVGHQGLWTYHIFFMDEGLKQNCLTFSFNTR